MLSLRILLWEPIADKLQMQFHRSSIEHRIVSELRNGLGTWVDGHITSADEATLKALERIRETRSQISRTYVDACLHWYGNPQEFHPVCKLDKTVDLKVELLGVATNGDVGKKIRQHGSNAPLDALTEALISPLF